MFHKHLLNDSIKIIFMARTIYENMFLFHFSSTIGDRKEWRWLTAPQWIY